MHDVIYDNRSVKFFESSDRTFAHRGRPDGVPWPDGSLSVKFNDYFYNPIFDSRKSLIDQKYRSQ